MRESTVVGSLGYSMQTPLADLTTNCGKVGDGLPINVLSYLPGKFRMADNIGEDILASLVSDSSF